MAFGTKVIIALWAAENGKGLGSETIAACDVLCVAHSPRSMVEQLRYWAELNAAWPASMRRELQAKLAEWQVAGEYQVAHEVPLGEAGVTLPVIFQFGFPDAGA